MPIIDLTDDVSRAPQEAPPAGEVAAAPRRLGLTLPELQAAAVLAGGAPLPFTVADPPTTGAIERELGGTASSDDAEFRAVLDSLPDPAESLVRRGLVTDGRLDPGPAGALGLLATPATAIDIDVALPEDRVRAWHRQSGGAVATLATADGIVFELSWYPAVDWPAELARAVAPPEELTMSESQVPSYLDLPLGLVDAATEAIATGRPDLLDVLIERSGECRGTEGTLDPGTAHAVVHALVTEARGRMRALAACTPADGPPDTIGVLSWTLLADGWRHLRPHSSATGTRLEITPADPSQLSGLLAPSLAVAR